MGLVLESYVAELVRTAQAEGERAWVPYPHQVPPPGDWDTWLQLGGRGSGKTEGAARFVRDHLVEMGARARVGIGAPTIQGVREVCAEGDSGLITIFGEQPKGEFRYNRSLGEAWHVGGGYVKFMGSEDEGRWNGPQWTLIWFDELALCNPKSWEQAQFGLRLGVHPRAIVSTTPKSRKFIKVLRDDPTTAVTTGTTYDNPALPKRRLEYFEKMYGGTRLGRQELLAEFIDDVEGAYWKREWIEAARVQDVPRQPTDDGSPGDPAFERVIVAIDPAGTHNLKSDETGIACAALGMDGEYYVLHVQGYRLSPQGWARQGIRVFETFMADKIVAETNNGGEMVEHTIRTESPDVPVSTIHASRGKAVRAEPIAALYEQGKVHHVGVFAEAEDQMSEFPVANENDDLVDSLVYALTELKDGGGGRMRWLE